MDNLISNNDIQVFESSEFGKLGVLMIDGKPFFPAIECAAILGYTKPHNAISRHCRASLKRGVIDNIGRKQEKIFISESDLYRLIFRSQLPEAEAFESWVCDEVLPAIRKHGAYLTQAKIEEVLLDPDTIIKLALELKAERQARLGLETRIDEMRPKEIFADAVSDSSTSILIGELAKLIKQNGIETGQNRLFEWLRTKNYLICRKGTDYNMPTQKSMERDLFEIIETTITLPDGQIIIKKTAKVTGKGQIYFMKKFLDG